MRYPFWRIGVFVVVLVWPLLWLYQAWDCLLYTSDAADE